MSHILKGSECQQDSHGYFQSATNVFQVNKENGERTRHDDEKRDQHCIINIYSIFFAYSTNLSGKEMHTIGKEILRISDDANADETTWQIPRGRIRGILPR